jgi:aspartate oxidase
VGCGVAGLYCALNLPRDKKIVIITKNEAPKSDSFLAQGGICVLRDQSDYKPFYDDTMRAGHYENDEDSVDIMIRSSQEIIGDLLMFGVRFEKNGQQFTYTKEGAHSRPRILFHEDETGKEIVRGLLSEVAQYSNIKILENQNIAYCIYNYNKEREEFTKIKKQEGEKNTETKQFIDCDICETKELPKVYTRKGKIESEKSKIEIKNR